jgi:DNA-binding NarL/FixJ family response regulator
VNESKHSERWELFSSYRYKGRERSKPLLNLLQQKNGSTKLIVPVSSFMKPMIRVLVADDHDAVRMGVRSCLRSQSEIEICGEAANGAEAIEKAVDLRPDIVLLDIAMPILNGFQVAKALRGKLPDTPILFYSVYQTPQMINEAKRVGLRGFVSKSALRDTLLKAVEALVVKKESFFPN